MRKSEISERNFQNDKLIDKFIKIPKNCPLCMKPYISKIPNNILNLLRSNLDLKLHNNLVKVTTIGELKSLIILFQVNILMRESYLSLRESIFGLFPRKPASIFFNIIKLWLLEEKNLNKMLNYR